MLTIPDSTSFAAEVSKHAGIVLVDFYTDSCTPCRNMNPVLAQLAEERADIKIVKVDAVANQELAVEFRISSVPTFILFNSGQVRGQFTGTRSKKDLVTWIEANR